MPLHQMEANPAGTVATKESSEATKGVPKRLINTGFVNQRKSKHGTDDATNLEVIEAIKNKTLPDRGSIQDSAKLDIAIDGKTLAKYCCHCG